MHASACSIAASWRGGFEVEEAVNGMEGVERADRIIRPPGGGHQYAEMDQVIRTVRETGAMARAGHHHQHQTRSMTPECV
jgi:hypothetical protein